MKFPTKLLGGKLVKRYRRFLVDVQLDSGTVVTAHCPNSGTMVGCCEPGRPVLLSESKDPHRRNAYTWEMINMNGTWVGVNVSVPRKVVAESLRHKRIPPFAGFTDLTLDAEYGHRKTVDILMQGPEHNLFMNVYHVAWAENGVAKFPETPNARARKGLADLTEIAEQGHRAVALFFVQRGDCRVLAPAVDVDPEFGNIVRTAQRQGVELMAYRADVSPDGIFLGVPIPCVLD
jgi:sugar fermentation stimulation protein A